MYFIVYILPIKELRVVPYRWTRGLNYEYAINNGVNRNVKISTFWTSDPVAFDLNGVPRIRYLPNFTASGQQFPAEGWYPCNIVKFKGKNS